MEPLSPKESWKPIENVICEPDVPHVVTKYVAIRAPPSPVRLSLGDPLMITCTPVNGSLAEKFRVIVLPDWAISPESETICTEVRNGLRLKSVKCPTSKNKGQAYSHASKQA